MLSLCKDVRQCKDGVYRKDKTRKERRNEGRSKRQESSQFILVGDISKVVSEHSEVFAFLIDNQTAIK